MEQKKKTGKTNKTPSVKGIKKQAVICLGRHRNVIFSARLRENIERWKREMGNNN